MTFGIGHIGPFPWKKETIDEYKKIGAKEVYYPFKFDVERFNSDKIIRKQSIAKKILPWIKQGFKVHIHTEQEGSKSKDNPIPTYLGSGIKSQNIDTVERVKAIIDFMKELEEDIKKEGGVEGKFGIVEVHSTAESNINKAKYEETLIENLNELSDYAKSKGHIIGIEYGKSGTTFFKPEVIENVLKKVDNISLVFDISLCHHYYMNYYQDKQKEAEEHLLEFFEKSINRICQIHWNNGAKNEEEKYIPHRPLFRLRPKLKEEIDLEGGVSRKILEKIASKARDKSNLWECYGALYKPEYKKDLDFLKHYFGKKA